jgi:hypothetical protein
MPSSVFANSGELAKPVLGDNAVERLDQSREHVRSTQGRGPREPRAGKARSGRRTGIA